MKKYMYLLIVLLIAISSCDTQKKAIIMTQPQIVEKSINQPTKKAKNIIFMVGDGMGITQISSGLYSNNNRLNLERVRTIGLHKCYAYDDLVTDSAAGATAFACGVKTYNGAIGVGPDTLPVQTILEAKEF